MYRLQSIFLALALLISFAAPCNSADASKTINHSTVRNQGGTRGGATVTKQVGQRVGLVLAYSGEWVLENGKSKRRIKERGFSVYEGERPLRTSKDGSLTIACVNNTTAICPGNHKIGEPFLLSEVEQVDDWWAQLLPFLSNYGTWIYPANRNVGGTVSLNDAVISEPTTGNALDISDVVASLPDGTYESEISKLPENAERTSESRKFKKTGVKFSIEKKDGTAVATKLGTALAPVMNLGVYTFKISSGPTNSKIDWTSLDSALFELVDLARYTTHKATLQVAMKKTETWKGSKQASARTELIRALIVAQSKAPASAYPPAFKAKPH